MATSRIILATSILACCAHAQVAPVKTTKTGAISEPIPAATFRSANGIAGLVDANIYSGANLFASDKLRLSVVDEFGELTGLTVDPIRITSNFSTAQFYHAITIRSAFFTTDNGDWGSNSNAIVSDHFMIDPLGAKGRVGDLGFDGARFGLAGPASEIDATNGAISAGWKTKESYITNNAAGLAPSPTTVRTDGTASLTLDAGPGNKGHLNVQTSSFDSLHRVASWSLGYFPSGYGDGTENGALHYSGDADSQGRVLWTMETGYSPDGGVTRGSEAHLTINNNRLLFASADDATGNNAAFGMNATQNSIIPANNTSGIPAIAFNDYRVQNWAEMRLWNQAASGSDSAWLRLLGSAGGNQNWFVGAGYEQNGTRSFFVSDVNAGNAARFYINSSGNVGIGTTSPTTKLDVNGTVKATAFSGDGQNLSNVILANHTTTLSGDTTIDRNGHGLSFGNSGTATPVTISGGLEVASGAFNAITATISNAATVGTTLGVTGALTAGSFNGSGSGLTGVPLTTAVSGILPSANGGTANGFTKFTGPTTSERTKTLRDASDTILELGGNYTPTGTWTNMTLVTPAIGTPSSGNGTNLTNLNASNISLGTLTNIPVTGSTGSFTTLAASGAITTTDAVAASSPILYATGALYTGGSGTTTFPAFFHQPSGATAQTTWPSGANSGVVNGCNEAAGFNGSFFDYRESGFAAPRAALINTSGSSTELRLYGNSASSYVGIAGGGNVNLTFYGTATQRGAIGASGYYSPTTSGFGWTTNNSNLPAGYATQLTQESAGIVSFDTGTRGDKAASWKATNGTLSGTLAVTGASTLTGTVTVGSAATIRAGAGSPESAVTATVGSLYLRTDGGAATTLYVKESGSGNTGWIAK